MITEARPAGLSREETRHVFAFWEKSIVVLNLFFATLPFSWVASGSRTVPLMSTLSNRLFQLTSFMILTFLLLSYTKVLSALRRAPWLCLLIVWCAASAAWATHFSTALKGVGTLFLATLMGVHFVLRYERDEQLTMLQWLLGISIVLNMAMVLFVPEYGITSGIEGQDLAHVGEWRGMYVHKNMLGRMSGLGAYMFLNLGFSGRGSRFVSFCLAGMALVLLYFSKSTSPLLVLGASLALVPIFQAMRKGTSILVMVVGTLTPIVLGGAAYFATHTSQVFALLGKDEGLTGRTMLWGLSWIQYLKSPWVGYGLTGFWNNPLDPKPGIWPCEFVWKLLKWEAPHAHNGFLDVLLQVGLVGFLLFLIGYGTALAKSIREVLRSRRKGESFLDAHWNVGALIFIFASNFTETTLIGGGLFWILYVATILEGVGVRERRSP